jgi:hypothetical protein
VSSPGVFGGRLPTEQEMEERIREICVRVTLAHDLETFRVALSELRVALREHVTEAQNRGIHMILEMPKPKSTPAVKDGTSD